MSEPGGSRGHGWLRRAFVAGWVAAFALMATAVASSWDRLVGVLARTPAPAAAAPRSTDTGAAGERELAEARRLRDQAEGALRATEVPSTRDPGVAP